MGVKHGFFSEEITQITTYEKMCSEKNFRSKKNEVDIRWEIFDLTWQWIL